MARHKFVPGELSGMMDALIHPKPTPEEMGQQKRAEAKTASLRDRGYETQVPAFLAACNRCGCIVSTVKEYLDAHDRWHENGKEPPRS